MWSISISSSSSLLCLLLLFLSTKTAIAERHKQKSSNSNYGQKLIYEKLDRFARSPVNALKLMKDYFRMGGFPNNLTLADREQAVKYILSLEKSLGKTGLKPFYGLEDGTLLGVWHGALDQVADLVSREPGNSGYKLDSFAQELKYWNVCLDNDSGTNETCQMDQDRPLFISCIDNCRAVPCKGDSSILCENYEILDVTTETDEVRGYVPTTYRCYNKRGDISEVPGEILVEFVQDDGTPTFTETGDCTFPNGNLVQRGDIVGDFAACGADTPCSTAYYGSYFEYNYDPRWRGWYIGSKATLKPKFSDPYLFFSDQTLGITYTDPIFLKDSDGNRVFHGVLAVDMTLKDVSNFLAEDFSKGNYFAAIYELGEPFGLIGTSSSETDIFKYVLQDDPSQSCSPEQLNINPPICDPLQVAVEDEEFFDTGLVENLVVYKAHMAFKEGKDLEFATILVDDEDVSSDSYIATAAEYDLTSWRIIVAQQLEVDPDDSILEGQKEFYLVSGIACMGFFLCFLLLLFYCRRRNEQAVMFSGVGLSSAFILGCAILNLSGFANLGETNDVSCLLRMWVFSLLASLMLSPLLVKSYQAYRLLGSSVAKAMSMKVKPMNDWLGTLLIPSLQCIILLVFTYADPAKATWDTAGLSLDDPVKTLVCRHESSWFIRVQSIFFVSLIISGCVLAYLTRNIDPRFGDSKALLFAMYNIAFTTMMLSIIFSTVDIALSGRYVLESIGLFWGTVFSAAAFVLPRLFSAKKDRKDLKKQRRRLNKRMSSMIAQRRENRLSTTIDDLNPDNLHETNDSLKVLLCTANVGNAPPTLESMRAWIPENGSCEKVTPLQGARSINREQFDIIVVGMQEATWKEKKNKKYKSTRTLTSQDSARSLVSRDSSDGADDTSHADDADDTSQASLEKQMELENAYISAVEGADSFALRDMMTTVLGSDYELLAKEQRGQMRQYVWALKDVASSISKLDIFISGTNTGIGNVLANKGGIVISMIYQETRITFLSAHLAAHEGEGYYRNRCEDVYNILKGSKTFELTQKYDIDTALSSHHMFVMGDLNFRTKFDGENNTHEDNVDRAGELIKKKDWATLYSFDELHKGVEDGDLLVGFKTLPCGFNPTFKVNRKAGYDYKAQRTPSYTDRILFRSAPNLRTHLRPLSYEPCVDFITSDHKPVRGAFSIVPNQLVDPKVIDGRYRLTFSELSCSNLLAGDIEGSSDPFIVLRWDGIQMKEEGAAGFLKIKRDNSAKTPFKRKTLNPTWHGKKIDLVTLGKEIKSNAMLYVCVYDYDFLSEDDILGSITLSIQELTDMGHGEMSRELDFDRDLERYGKYGGKIKFKLGVEPLVG